MSTPTVRLETENLELTRKLHSATDDLRDCQRNLDESREQQDKVVAAGYEERDAKIAQLTAERDDVIAGLTESDRIEGVELTDEAYAIMLAAYVNGQKSFVVNGRACPFTKRLENKVLLRRKGTENQALRAELATLKAANAALTAGICGGCKAGKARVAELEAEVAELEAERWQEVHDYNIYRQLDAMNDRAVLAQIEAVGATWYAQCRDLLIEVARLKKAVK